MRVTQERVAWPSTSTVHAPHCPSPQPYLLPVRPSSYRSTERRLSAASPSTSCVVPLTRRGNWGIRDSLLLSVLQVLQGSTGSAGSAVLPIRRTSEISVLN